MAKNESGIVRMMNHLNSCCKKNSAFVYMSGTQSACELINYMEGISHGYRNRNKTKKKR